MNSCLGDARQDMIVWMEPAAFDSSVYLDINYFKMYFFISIQLYSYIITCDLVNRRLATTSEIWNNYLSGEKPNKEK